MSRIAVVGGITLDILFEVPRLPEPHEKLPARQMMVAGGGAASNVAYWLARLGHRVQMFSVAGTDPLTGVALDSLAGAGVDLSGVRRVPGLGPSISAIFSNGSYKSMVGGGNWDAARAHWQEMLAAQDFSTHDHVHIIPRVYPFLFGAGRRADLTGRPVSSDLNGTYDPGMIAALDLAISNHDEITAQAGPGDIGARVAADLGDRPYHLVVTRAAEEVAVFHNGHDLRIRPTPLPVVDRAGGGDAFCAGFLHACDAGASAGRPWARGCGWPGRRSRPWAAPADNATVDAALAALGEPVRA